MELTRRLKFGLFSLMFAGVLFVSPFVASAATKNFVCADFTTLTQVTCSSGTLTFAGGSVTEVAAAAGSFSFTSGQTYYYQYTLTQTNGTTGALNFRAIPSQTPNANTQYASGAYSGSWVVSANDTGVEFRYSTGGTKWGGTISGICVSDTADGCSGGPGPSPTPSGGGGFVFPIASSTEAIGSAMFNVGVIIALLAGIILGFIVALISVGYFLWKVRQNVTGSKF